MSTIVFDEKNNGWESFYSYHPNSSSYQNEIDSGSLVEQYIIQSGSYEEGKPYLDVGKMYIDFDL